MSAPATPTVHSLAFDHRRTRHLPAPVRTWLDRCVESGVVPPRRADLDTSGEIRLGRWWHYDACQVLAPPTELIWCATTHIGPFSIVGSDRYVDGVGRMRWVTSGGIPVLRAGGPGTSRSGAGRLAGEALLVPTFALGPWIEWEPINETRALAHVTIHRVVHSVEAEFDDGRLVTCSQPRWCQDRRGGRSRVFGVRFAGAVTQDGITMPTNWIAGWDWDGDDWWHGPFFRAQLEAVRFTVSRANHVRATAGRGARPGPAMGGHSRRPDASDDEQPMNRPDQRAGGDHQLKHLDESLIRHRLERARLARLGFVHGDQPMIVPINVRADDNERIVFRTAAGTIVDQLDGCKVAVEIDGHDPATRTGWSVLVLGVARDVTDAADPDAVRLRSVPVDSWAPGERSRCFAVLPLSITGRVIPIGPNGDWFAGVPAS